MFSGFTNQPHIKPKIVYRGNLFSKVFIGGKQVTQIGFGIFGVNKSVTHFVHWRKIVFPLFILNVDGSICGKQHSVSGVSCWHHTIEHVNSKGNILQNINWSAHSHQISGFVFGKNITNNFGHRIHFLSWFTYRKSTDGVALLTRIRNVFS